MGIPLLIVSARRRLASFLTVAAVIFVTIYLWPEPKKTVAAGRVLLAAVGTLGKEPVVELLFLSTVAVAAAQFVLWRRVVTMRLALAD